MPPESAPTLRDDASPGRSPATAAEPTSLSAGHAARNAPAGAEAGRYRIVRSHARGGLGEVFVAVDEQLRREVALKEIQGRHAWQADSCRRFLLEAEVTGRLEHPGIVPVYGLGRHADGRPYYAMRFIRGEELREAIDRFHARSRRSARTAAGSIDSGTPQGKSPTVPDGPLSADVPAARNGQPGSADFQSLEFRQLLRRFVDVCNAIAYAHSRGVLHRDLKPRNIMLGEFGETLVVDWGLAKLIGDADLPASLDAGLRQGIDGTGSSATAPVDNTAAATQLGAAIGTPAYMSPEQAAGELSRLGPASDIYSLGATLYAMLAGKPPLAGSMQDMLMLAAQGAVPPVQSVNPQIPPALAAVVGRAMAPRPADRYPTALDLAKDIEAWLADEPVAAWREPWAMRARRWWRRRPRLAGGAAAAVVVALAAFAVGAALLGQKNNDLERAYAKLEKAFDDVDAARGQAESRLAELRKGRDLLAGLFENLNPQGRGAREVGDQGLAVRLGQRLRQTAQALDDDAVRDPETLADLQDTLGFTLAELGHHKDAEPLLRRALAFRIAAYGEADPRTLRARSRLGQSVSYLGDDREALRLHGDNARLFAEVFGERHPETLAARSKLAVALMNSGKLDEALPLYRQNLAAMEGAVGPDHEDTISARFDLASGLSGAGRHAEALPLLRSVVAATAKTRQPDDLLLLRRRAQLARTLESLSLWDEAFALHRADLPLREAALGKDHPEVLQSRHVLALALKTAGRTAEALALFEALLPAVDAKLGPDHPDTHAVRSDYASTLSDAGRVQQALPLFRQAADGYAAKLGARHPSTLSVRGSLANALQQANRLDEALPLLKESADAIEAAHGPDVPAALTARGNYAVALRNAGRLAEGLAILQQVADRSAAALGPTNPETIHHRGNLATLLNDAGRHDEAAKLHREVLATLETAAGKAHPETIVSRHNLGSTLATAGDLAAAAPLLRQAYADAKRVFGMGHPYTRAFEASLVGCLGKLQLWAEQQPILQARLDFTRRTPPAAIDLPKALAQLAWCLHQQKRAADAAPLLAECEALLAKAPSGPNAAAAMARIFLGGCRLREGKHAEGEALVQSAYDDLGKVRDLPAKVRRLAQAEAADRLVEHADAVGRAADAARWRAEAARLRAPPKLPPATP